MVDCVSRRVRRLDPLVGSRAVFLRRAISKWGAGNLRRFPWRRTRSPFRVCVAEILLQQTFARKVVPVYTALTTRYPTPLHLSRARLTTLRRMISPLGLLYRAKTLREFARTIETHHKGRVPRDKALLLALPGVGAYTAAAVRVFAFGERDVVIDTNVVRVLSRYFGLGSKLPSSVPTPAVVRAAGLILPRTGTREFNYGLLDFGASVCSHYRPSCTSCILSRTCSGFQRVENAGQVEKGMWILGATKSLSRVRLQRAGPGRTFACVVSATSRCDSVQR